jgi:hypothetical protein
MKTLLPVRVLFWIAAAYEMILGLAFIVAGPAIFSALAITPPNHWGYLHFSAGLLVVFGFMFYQIARDPVAHHELIPYGILLKICYVATVAWYWYDGDVPPIWKVFALLDLGFALLFFWSMIPIEAAVAPAKPSIPSHAT